MEDVESPYSGKEKVSEIARRVLGFSDLKDKIICFIPRWERHKQSILPPDPPEAEIYSANEFFIFQSARQLLLKDGCHKFIVFREMKEDAPSTREIKRIFKKYPHQNDLAKLTEALKKKLFPDKRRRKIEDVAQQLIALIDQHIRVYEDTESNRELLKTMGLAETFHLSVLCMDYRYFSKNLTYEFVRYCEAVGEEIKITQDLHPLFKLFNRASPDAKTETFWFLSKIIRRASKNELTTDDLDDVEYLSMNHVQNIKIPDFWRATQPLGYTCPAFNEQRAYLPREEKADFRFFYSFESLLMFDLKNRLLKIRRCLNCKSVLTKGYMGKYCSSGSNNYATCCKDRNKKRQKRHYDLTKT